MLRGECGITIEMWCYGGNVVLCGKCGVMGEIGVMREI